MPPMPARMCGSLLVFICTFFLIGTIPYFFKPNPFEGVSLKQAQATIVSLQPGTRSRFPSYHNGIYYSYVFPDEAGENQHGHFFIRSRHMRYYQPGDRLDVEYRPDQPWINRRRGETSNDYLFPQILAFLFATGLVIGIVMLCTGRDFIADWKKTLEYRP